MKKAFFYGVCSILLLVCSLACVLAYILPSVGELTKFIGKTEEEVCERFGSPWAIATVCMGTPFKEGVYADEDKWNEWCEQNIKSVLTYGNVHVDINFHGKVADVRRGNFCSLSFPPMKPAPEEPAGVTDSAP